MHEPYGSAVSGAGQPSISVPTRGTAEGFLDCLGEEEHRPGLGSGDIATGRKSRDLGTTGSRSQDGRACLAIVQPGGSIRPGKGPRSRPHRLPTAQTKPDGCCSRANAGSRRVALILRLKRRTIIGRLPRLDELRSSKLSAKPVKGWQFANQALGCYGFAKSVP